MQVLKTLALSGLALIGTTAYSPPTTGATAAQIPGWRYCRSAQWESSTVYFSRVFPSDTSIYVVGVQNSFNSYVSGRHDSKAISGALCMGLYDTAQEAQDELNDDAAKTRRDGLSAVFTLWSYHGD